MTNSNGPRTGRPPIYAMRGMVSSPHYLASESGMKALRQGGSAVDASIALNLTMAVVYSHMSGLGGDGFWLLAGGKTTGVEAIRASGPSAARATIEHYRKHGHTDAIPDRGPLAALTVPGALDGFRIAHERYGKLDWADLFEDAIHYARHGFAVTRSLADWLVADEALLRQYPGMAEIFLPDGKPQREGGFIAQPGLADTLELIARKGARDAFYEGELAARICAGLRPGGSPLAPEDFADYHAEWVAPISTSYRGYDIYQLPPSTQGMTAIQVLNLLEGFDVAGWGDNTADYYHHMAEVLKVAAADRDEWLTDPNFVDIPLETLLSKPYADERRKLIRADRSLAVDGIEPGLRYGAEFDKPAPRGGTVYFCVTDSDGLMVSKIQSPYYDFGACVMGGDTGIIMQNRGSFFSLDENHPNRLEPKKNTFHTIIPALAVRDGMPAIAYGTMGGEGQSQTQAAMLTRMIDFGYDVQQAIEAPRWLFGRTWGMESRDLWMESDIPENVLRELSVRGQPVKRVGRWDSIVGHAQAIRWNAGTGFYEGGADPRGDGCVIGY
ncbi:gamma-glutamyltransferase [Sinisalibacter aestuarii]|uniref:Glutathione hydrolase proenzyme n=1 Tax=Sinisalibacter aestuarii TaxID=2949426 RepID=A0ABQ5LR25_9RHOB|nr:gamma-glutamyltransferase [Sinisalibacter aestuarii]GKY86860.1 gamma-glutamyltranspeptidase [Sinisalibacter aestuarii]